MKAVEYARREAEKQMESMRGAARFRAIARAALKDPEMQSLVEAQILAEENLERIRTARDKRYYEIGLIVK